MRFDRLSALFVWVATRRLRGRANNELIGVFGSLPEAMNISSRSKEWEADGDDIYYGYEKSSTYFICLERFRLKGKVFEIKMNFATECRHLMPMMTKAKIEKANQALDTKLREIRGY